MTDNAICIRGAVTSSGNGAPGVGIELVDRLTERVVATNVTGAGGEFRIDLHPDVDPELVAAVTDRRLTLRSVDATGASIIRNRNVTGTTGEQRIDLTIGAARLRDAELLGRPIERVTGSPVDVGQLDAIDRAIDRVVGPESDLAQAWRTAARCPLPPLAAFDGLLDDAWGVIDGDPRAPRRFRDSLDRIASVDPEGAVIRGERLMERSGLDGHMRGRLAAIRGRRRGPGATPHSFTSGFSPVGAVPTHPCFLPPERIAPVMFAALQLADGGSATAQMLGAIDIGLCGIGRMNTLLAAADDVLAGRGDERFTGLMRRHFGECGPDDGPIPSFPEPIPNPDPWCPDPPDGPSLPDPCELERIECARQIVESFRRPTAPDYLITSITPDTACPGDTVVIAGSGFGGASAAVCFPRATGGASICVDAESWTDTEIEVIVPEGTGAGDVSLRIPDGVSSICGRLIAHHRQGSGVTFFDGGSAGIDWFNVDGMIRPCLYPGVGVVVAWSASSTSPSPVRVEIFDGATRIFDATNEQARGSVDFTAPNVSTDLELVARLTVTGRCGPTSVREVPILVTVKPTLGVDGMEVTQGIQRFWRPGVVWNSLPTVNDKDTIVRVYVTSDRDGFNQNLTRVTGTLQVGTRIYNPINGVTPTSPAGDPFIDARPAAEIDREVTDHTLNFRVPAAECSGTKRMTARIIGPLLAGARVERVSSQDWTWQNENALRVRYVRIRDGNSSNGTNQRPSAGASRFTVERGVDLLPTPPNDIGPAWRRTWNTSRDITTLGGLNDLLADLEDEHNCSAWEWATQWAGSDCPADDGAIWVGLTEPFNRGLAYRPGNTALSARYENADGQGAILRIKTGHEVAHNLSLRHVNRSCSSGSTVGGPFYGHPNGGLLVDVPFDPYWNQAVAGSVGDVMSYECTRWTSGDSWTRLRNQI